MAALIRRLSNFTTKPYFHANAKPSLLFSSTKTSTHDNSELQNMVEKFKKSSEDPTFRRRKDFYTRTIKRLATAKQFAMIENIIEHQKKFSDIRNEGFVVRLISLYGESDMFNHAHKLFDEMPILNCPRTVKSFNALLSSGIAAKEFRRVFEAFRDIPSKISVEPDTISYNTLIHALCETGSLEEALSTIATMGKKCDNVTFNTLFSALYKNRRFSEAESLWGAMEQSGVRPNARSYNMRLRAMFMENEVDEAVALAAEIMRNKEIRPDGFTFNTLIRGFCGIGDLEEADKYYGILVKRHLCGSHLVSTYWALIPAFCEAGDFDKALELCCDAARLKITLRPAFVKRVVDGLEGKGRIKDALKLKKLMDLAE